MIRRATTTLFFLLAAGAALAATEGNSPDSFGCTAADATSCWQAAIAHATLLRHLNYFTDVVATPGMTYVIRDTLTIASAYGGTINGNGSVLEWQGPPDRPMFLAKNTQQLHFSNLRIVAAMPLEAAFEFTKAPYVKEPERNVAPSENVIDSVSIEGVNLGKLKYGIRFSKRYGIDEDNDQSTIMNTAIYNVTEAAISIEHTQSQHHHFYAVKATGAKGNQNASFVRADSGSFASLGGFHGGFAGAVYSIASVYGTDLVVDEDSEGSARFIRTPVGAASFPFPVHIIGGRFSIDHVASDGRFVDFHRMGPLSIDGLRVDGNIPPGALMPAIAFLPDPVAGKGQGNLIVNNLTFNVPNSASWDVLLVNGATRLSSLGNSCIDERGNVAPCRGLANGISSMGGGISHRELAMPPFSDLPAGHAVFCEDCAAERGSGSCVAGGPGRIALKLRKGWTCG